MAIPTRVNGPGTFFITSVTWERRRIFQVEAHARLFLDKLEACRENYLLHEYVVMPDHVHLLITPGKLTLERTMQLIKGGSSHALGSKSPVWQRGFSDVRVRDARDAASRIRYIEENPLGAHLARNAWEYPFSSASPDALKLDALPVHLRMPPQGLKPRFRVGVCGTAEAVPFQPGRGGPSETEAAPLTPGRGGPPETEAVALEPGTSGTAETEAVALTPGNGGTAETEATTFQGCTQHCGNMEHHALRKAAKELHGESAMSSERKRVPDLNDYAAWLGQGNA